MPDQIDFKEAERLVKLYHSDLRRVKPVKLLPDRNQPKVLGCGSQGCVLELPTPKIVMKVIPKENSVVRFGKLLEPEFVQYAIYKPIRGMVAFFDIIEIDEYYFIWRTDSINPPIGKGLSFKDRETLRDILDASRAIFDRMWFHFLLENTVVEYADFLQDLRTDQLHYVIKALLYYLDQGWIIGDIHQHNIGLSLENNLEIRDPGFVMQF